jgi:hypothetical protein
MQYLGTRPGSPEPEPPDPYPVSGDDEVASPRPAGRAESLTPM